MEIREGLTFDDVLLQPRASDILPANADLQTRLTRDIKINVPLVSAAMDTVTEARLAIVMAQTGGIGVIHRNMSNEEQAEEVRKVLKALAEHHNISGIPVVEPNGKLVGIVTNRDVRFATDPNELVSRLMTTKLVTIKVGATEAQARSLLHEHRIERLLVVDDDYRCVGLITVKDMDKAENFPNACKDNQGRLRVAAASTVGPAGYERAMALVDAGVDAVVIDGADAIKVGIGPGSICTTRIVAGIGVPQLTAIMDACAVAQKANVPVIADGGVKYSGDMAKALAAGAESCMVGSMLAGAEETPGEVFLFQGRSYKSYRGMGSVSAMARGSADRYFQKEVSNSMKLVPEGVEGRVAYKGPVAPILHQLIGGVRATMGYTGSKNISELHERAKFIRITNAGLRESHVHDVTIARESPNYTMPS